MPRYDWQQHKDKLNALYPIYGADGGNYTAILLAGGEIVEYRKRTDTAVEECCRAFGTTRQALARLYGPKVNLTVDVPLPLAPGLVLVPLDMRAPLAKGHGAVGYVVLGRCAGVEAAAEKGYASRVVFVDGTAVLCRFRPEAVKDRLLRAQQVEREYLAVHETGLVPWQGGPAFGLPTLDGREPVMAIIGYAYALGRRRGRAATH